MLPPHRATIAIAIGLLLGMIGVGCSRGSRAPTGVATATTHVPAGTEPATANATFAAPPSSASGSEPPGVTLRTPADHGDMLVGTFCWGDRCQDAVGVLTPHDSIPAAPGDELNFGGDAFREPLSEVQLELWLAPEAPLFDQTDWLAWRHPDKSIAVPLVGGRAILPDDLAPGTYVAALSLKFAGGGDAFYGALIAVGG